MSIPYCTLPLPSVVTPSLRPAANAPQLHPLPVALAGNVRLLTALPQHDGAQFALAGRLSDVCAALDQLAQQAQLHAPRLQVVCL